MLQQIETFVRVPDWRLTTAEILYHLPDNHGVLQTFVWQKLDRAPGFPELSRFLDFWRREIEGPLHSVRVASSALIRPAELRYANGQFTLQWTPCRAARPATAAPGRGRGRRRSS